MKRIACFLIPLWLGSLHGSEATPQAPFIAPPPEFGSWTVQVLGAAQKEQAQKIHCVKTGEIKRDTFIEADGTRRELWYVGKFALTKYEHSQKVALEDAAGLARERGSKTGSLVYGAGFPGFTWLDLRHYKGVTSVGGRRCHHFQLPPETGQSGVEAWVDADTKYPVAIKAEGLVYAYEFHAPPSGMLQLPPEYAEALRRHEAHLKQLNHLEKGR